MNTEEARNILGLAGTGKRKDIRRAYLRMAKRWHPDLYADPAQKARGVGNFIRAREAYEVLMESSEPDRADDDQPHGSNGIPADDEPSGGGEDLGRQPERKSGLCDRLFGALPEPLSFLLFPPLVAFIFYAVVARIVQDAWSKWVRGASSAAKKGADGLQSPALGTLAALLYLPILYWAVFTKGGEAPPTGARMIMGVYSSAGIILHVLDGWIGFFASKMSKRPTRTAMCRR